MIRPFLRRALLRRVLREHRRIVVPLVVLLLADVLAYAFLVQPMASDVANIEARNRTAESTLAAARAEFELASGTLTGKDAASKELATFYDSVLPKGFVAARRLTVLRLQQMADDANLTFERLSSQDVVPSKGTLTQLKMQMLLVGSYANMRAFLHRLEIAPEFVVIDNVALTEGDDDGAALSVTLDLSTYYRDGAS